jgi:hypothetical protein
MRVVVFDRANLDTLPRSERLCKEVGLAARLLQVDACVGRLTCLRKGHEIAWAKMSDDMLEYRVLSHDM